MSFKRLEIPTQKTTSNDALTQVMQKCKGKSFEQFWDILGRPDGINGPSPLHEFQKHLISDLQEFKRVALLASRNLGKSEIALRYALYMTLCQQIPGNYAFITGIGYTLSRSLCRRAKRMLEKHNVYFDDNSTTMTFPNAKWSFFGSDSKGWRGQSEIVYLCCDEVAHFPDSEDWRASIDTYAIKNSGATIIIITTPSNHIDGIAHRLFREPDDQSLYKHVFLNYKEGIGTMYKPDQIELLKRTSESFESEYNLKWGYAKVGNVFTSKAIDDALALKYDPENTRLNSYSMTSMGIDYGQTGGKGFGGGFACVVTAFEDGIIKVLEARLWTNAEFNEVLEDIRSMIQVCNPVKIFTDGSAVAWCRALKLTPEVNENPDYQDEIRRYRQMKIDWTNNMKVIPVSWMRDQASMLGNTKMLFDQKCIAVDPSFDKLVTALRSCVAQNMRVQKNLSQFNDLIDALILSCHEYKMGQL